MYSIKSLEKEYKTRHIGAQALNGITFDLPDKGMVFIVGKSGSGKSTLLNILGGLDKATSGQVIYKDRDLSTFTSEELDRYRNSEISFVFQSNYLINRFTVRENLQLILDLNNDMSSSLIEDTLEKLEIADLIDRYPSELSAGQAERVAIARALVNNPNVLLADEPTGNLDSKTSKIILNIFKKISKEKLVVIVSHNPVDASDYADRIIEIQDGIVVSDKERIAFNTDELSLTDNTLSIPSERPLTFDETEVINELIREKGGALYIIPHPKNFTESSYKHTNQSLSLKKNSLSTKTTLKYAFKNIGPINFVITLLLTTIVVMLIGICESFSSFTPTKELIREEENAVYDFRNLDNPVNTIAMYKSGEIYEDSLVTNYGKLDYFTDEEIETMEELAGQKSYKLYPLSERFVDGDNVYYYQKSDGKLKAIATTGVLVCDREYLSKMYGDENGNINMLAGELSETSVGFIITDFYFDLVKRSTYIVPEALVKNNASKECIYSKVIGVIDTGYKNDEAFVEFLKSYQQMPYKELTQYAGYITYIYNHLLCAYSINPTWAEDYIRDKSDKGREMNRAFYLPEGEIAPITEDEEESEVINFSKSYISATSKAQKDQVSISYQYFNLLFPEYALTVENKTQDVLDLGLKVKISMYNIHEEMFYENEYFVKSVYYRSSYDANIYIGILEDGKDTDVLTRDGSYLNLFFKEHIKPVALYFVDTENLKELNDFTQDVDNQIYFINNFKVLSLTRTYQIVTIFKEIFILVLVLLFVVMLMLLSSSSFLTVIKRKQEIGILKSVGASSKDISKIYIMQAILLGLAIALFSSILYLVAINYANDLVVTNLVKFNGDKYMNNLKVVSFRFIDVLINSVTLIIVSFLSAFIPLSYIKKLDPINIIRGKDN